MKHAISSLEYLLEMKGFSHAASGHPMDPAHSDSSDYNTGYFNGVNIRRDYAKKVCEKFGLVNPEPL